MGFVQILGLPHLIVLFSGLFRDRNVTLRKAIKMNHGAADITMKGKIEE